MMTNENKSTSFPSEFVPKEVKATKAFQKKYSEAFHTESANAPTAKALCRNNKDYKRWRQYGRAEQPQTQYKELLMLRKKRTGNAMKSFRNINYENLKVVPRLINSLVSQVASTGLNLMAKPIDPTSVTRQRQYKGKILEYMVNQERIQQFEMLSKLGLERPIGPGEQMPQTMSQVDVFVERNPKDMAAKEVLDHLQFCFEDSKRRDWAEDIIRDIAEVSIGIERQYIDVNNKVKTRRVIPERAVANLCIMPDFSDLIRFGEYREITVGELRRDAAGWLTEVELKDIANKATGETARYSGTPQSYYDSTTYSYAYDHERVTVFDIIYLSTDVEVNMEYKTESGNGRVKRMKPDYVPFKGDASVNEGKGMGYDDYNQKYAGEKKLHRTEERNVYQCIWVVDTEYVYKYGLMPNQIRPSTNWQEARLPVAIFTTNFQSAVELIEQAADQAQLNYLHYQSHLSQSRPSGIAIEKRALARVAKGNVQIDPLEALEMYAETGNIYYDGNDAHGNPLQQKPFEILPNGLSPGAIEHLNLSFQWIDFMREGLGLNDLTAGMAPAERLGKKVAQMGVQGSTIAMSHIRTCYKKIYERSAQNMFYLLQNVVQMQNPEIMGEALGPESYQYLMLNRDLPLLDMGIILQEDPAAEIKDQIFLILNKMIDAKEISGPDAVRIMLVDNPYRQLDLIDKNNMDRERRQQAAAEQQMRVQGEENTKTAVALEQAKQAGEAQKNQMTAEIERARLELELQLEDKKFLHESLLQQAEFTNDERDRRAEYIKTLMQKRMDLQKQELANKKPVSSPSK
jgi:hypothetical protein